MSEFSYLPCSCVITEEAFDINIMNKDSKSQFKYFSISGVKISRFQ